jgi:hypothetical protein
LIVDPAGMPVTLNFRNPRSVGREPDATCVHSSSSLAPAVEEGWSERTHESSVAGA